MFTAPWTASVHHDGSPLYIQGDSHAIGSSVTIRIRTGHQAPISAIFLRTAPDGEQHFAPMTRTQTDDLAYWWEAEMPLTMPAMNYRFLLHTAEGKCWLTANGIVQHTPIDTADFKLLAGYQAPAWVTESVFYQIFPDRFADGDPSSNVTSGEYLCHNDPVVASPWGAAPVPGSIDFFGGDLQGISEHLDYLTDLGVTALYLTPIFTSPSNHKYDVADYREVDRHFGGNAALAQLRQSLDEHAMRLMLDIVPNHCSADNPWFLDAQRDSSAPTNEYFTFTQHPEQYESWLGVRSLPKLNYRSLALRHEMYSGPDAIMKMWMRPPYRIDGWRMDVANMLGRQGETQIGNKIGRAIRKSVKAENPNLYLLGENFFDGSRHLQGDELDATMNYRGFLQPFQLWLTGFDMDDSGRKWTATHQLLSTDGLMMQWHTFLSAIPWEIALQQLNLLDSHDTRRMLTIAQGDEAKMRLAVAILFTFPGVPCMFYGDEVGIVGGPDPDCRRCMPWDSSEWNIGLREWYRTIIALRRSIPALQQGGFQELLAGDNSFAFLRELPDERCIIVARRDADNCTVLPVQAGNIPDGTRWYEEITHVTATVVNGTLPLQTLPDVGVQIWREVRSLDR